MLITLVQLYFKALELFALLHNICSLIGAVTIVYYVYAAIPWTQEIASWIWFLFAEVTNVFFYLLDLSVEFDF